MALVIGEKIVVTYDDTTIIENLDITIPEGKITSIIGPNGCGKSTILKALSRIISVKKGTIYLDGKAIEKENNLEIAKKMAILPQSPSAPSGLTVEELVAYGRYPHMKGFGKLTNLDKEKIKEAISLTGLEVLSNRYIDTLSGGQRQRAWIAMALAQDSELILLDEPTTYLDLVHQLEVLHLLYKLNREKKKTIALVIHDLNMAARFSDYMIAVKKGEIVHQGSPEQIMTHEVLKDIFNIDAQIITDTLSKIPLCLSYNLL